MGVQNTAKTSDFHGLRSRITRMIKKTADCADLPDFSPVNLSDFRVLCGFFSEVIYGREMKFDIGFVIVVINLVIGIVIAILSIKSARFLQGGILSWVARAFLVTGILYAVHAGIEVLGLGEELYAVSALVATLLFGFSLIIIGIVAKLLGTK